MPQTAKIVAGGTIAVALGALIYISYIAAVELKAHPTSSAPTTSTSVNPTDETEKNGNSLGPASDLVELNPEIPENIKATLDRQETKPAQFEEKGATSALFSPQPRTTVKPVQKVQPAQEEIPAIEDAQEVLLVEPIVSQPELQVSSKPMVKSDCGIECQRLKSKNDLEREAMATMSSLIWECNRREKLSAEKIDLLRDKLVQFKADPFFRDQNGKLLNCLTELNKN